MVSPQTHAYIQKLRENPPFGANGFNLADLRQCMATRRPPSDPAVSCRRTDIDGIPGEWVVAPGADPAVRLLYLHGGGFVSGSSDFYLAMAALLSSAARCAVLLPDYRLAPEHPFPAALEDCLRAHVWITRTGPDGPAPAQSTFIAGDSAGGGLMLAALLTLRDQQRPMPNAGIALSPFADLTLTADSIRTERDRDPIMHPDCLPDFVTLYLAGADAHDPRASPVLGDYHGVPPLLIQAGEHEVIRDDSLRVAAQARAHGVDVTLEIWPGMFHVFQAHDPQLPEVRDAIAHLAAFLHAQATKS